MRMIRLVLATALSWTLATPAYAISAQDRDEEIADFLSLLPAGRKNELLVELYYRIDPRLSPSERNFMAKVMAGHTDAKTPEIAIEGKTITIGSGANPLKIAFQAEDRDLRVSINGRKLTDEEQANPEKRAQLISNLLSEGAAKSKAGVKKGARIWWPLMVSEARADFSDWLPWIVAGGAAIWAITKTNEANSLRQQLTTTAATTCADPTPRCCMVGTYPATYSWRYQDACCQFQGGVALPAGQACPAPTTTTTTSSNVITTAAPTMVRTVTPASAAKATATPAAVAKPATAAPASAPAGNQ